MIYDVQKASIYKRISAYLFDAILLVILAVGCAFLLSTALRYQDRVAERDAIRADYETQYGVTFDVTSEDYEKMTEEERKAYDDAYRAFVSDPAANRADQMLINLTLIITVFGILGAYLVLELLIPLLLKNGQTLGKKIFGIGVMRVDGIRLSPFQLTVRTVLGKYTLETMLPILLVLTFFFMVMPMACFVGLILLALVQLACLFTSRFSSPIHDRIAGTVTVDLASQLIFDSVEELTAYKKRLHAEMVERAEYR